MGRVSLARAVAELGAWMKLVGDAARSIDHGAARKTHLILMFTKNHHCRWNFCFDKRPRTTIEPLPPNFPRRRHLLLPIHDITLAVSARMTLYRAIELC